MPSAVHKNISLRRSCVCHGRHSAAGCGRRTRCEERSTIHDEILPPLSVVGRLDVGECTRFPKTRPHRVRHQLQAVLRFCTANALATRSWQIAGSSGHADIFLKGSEDVRCRTPKPIRCSRTPRPEGRGSSKSGANNDLDRRLSFQTANSLVSFFGAATFCSFT
jgi:hypothetical protein